MNLYDHVWQMSGYCADGCDRAREVLEPLADRMSDNGWTTLLDIGCGHGHVVRWLREHRRLQAFGVDPFLPESPRPHLLRGDPATLAAMGCRFDVVASFDVLEHLTWDSALGLLRVMRELSPRALLAIANMPDLHEVPGLGPTDLHLIQEPAAWWAQRIRPIFGHARVQPLPYPERFFIWAGDWP